MTDTNLIADREQFIFKSFEQLKLNDYLNENDDSCLNLMKFSCSTPIKFTRTEETTNNDDKKQFFTQLNENHSMILNQSNCDDKKKSPTDYLFEKCDPNKLDETNCDLNDALENTFKQNSLLEFEQNEKLAQESLSANCQTTSPVFHLESLLSNLRSNSNLNINKIATANEDSTDDKPSEDAKTQITPNKQSNNGSTRTTNYFRANDHVVALENRIENEILRRQHCEKQIHELNENLLELQQQLAVAKGLNRKKEILIQNMEISIQKILESWKQKELQHDSNLSKAKLERETFINNETRFKMKIQLLEQELKKVGDELVHEKVKSQEYHNEISTLKISLNDLKQSKTQTTDELNSKNEELNKFKDEASSLSLKLNELKTSFENLSKEKKENEESFSSEIDVLKSMNKSLNDKNNEMKSNYETLIKEAKLVINESEKQYNCLVKEIEAEKLNKDSLQVEINMLEEKLSETVKMISNDYENKIHKLQTVSFEREKTANENHKNELEQLQSKARIEFEKFKSKHYDEVQEKTKDYETKLTELNLQIDSHRNEIERLKRANNDLENDRNSIRKNLKQMLELQMKEAMQLLGVSNETTYHLNATTTPFDSTSLTSSSFLNKKTTSTVVPQMPLIPSPKPSTQFSFSAPSPPNTKEFESSINDIINKFQISSMHKTNSPNLNESSLIHNNHKIVKAASLSSASSTASNSSKSSSVSDLISPSFQQPSLKNSVTMPIKDSFILNQIDLINQYYHIDNKTLASNKTSTVEPDKSIFSSSSTTTLANTNHTHKTSMSNLMNNSSNNFFKSQESLNKTENNDKNTSSTTRGNELRHFIEILLNRSPTSPATSSIAPASTAISAPIQKPDYLSTINSSSIIIESSLINKNINPTQNLMRSISSHNIGVNASDYGRLSLPSTNYNEKLTLAPKKNEFMFNEDYTDIDDTYNDLVDGNKSKSLFNNFELDDDYDERKIKYNDISDMEDTGYMKRESTEYYDDVKRTLNFDDDDDERATPRNIKKSQFLHSTSTPTLLKENNKLSLLAQDTEIQNVNNILDVSNKKSCLVSKSQPCSLKKNQSNSASTSQLSCQQQASTNKKISIKKLKSSKKSNNNVSLISNISSRSLSMISLGQQSLSCESNTKQTKGGKPIWK